MENPMESADRIAGSDQTVMKGHQGPVDLVLEEELQAIREPDGQRGRTENPDGAGLPVDLHDTGDPTGTELHPGRGARRERFEGPIIERRVGVLDQLGQLPRRSRRPLLLKPGRLQQGIRIVNDQTARPTSNRQQQAFEPPPSTGISRLQRLSEDAQVIAIPIHSTSRPANTRRIAWYSAWASEKTPWGHQSGTPRSLK